LLAAGLTLTHWLLDWPDPESDMPLIYIPLAVSLVPLALALADFVASRRAVFSISEITLDFSRAEADPAMRPSAFQIPENTGIAGTRVENNPMGIAPALQEATADEVAIVDLEDGRAWWATRLLALCAGAVRAGAPKALVFLGVQQNAGGALLGWAEPAALLDALFADRPAYQSRYNRAFMIAQQMALFGDPDLQPQIRQPVEGAGRAQLVAHDTVRPYSSHEAYVRLGPAAFEQILMDQLAMDLGDGGPASGSLERPPDRLTLGRLRQLFEHCLYTDAVDLDAATEEQIAGLLDSQAPYVALVRHGRYQGLLKREMGERLILRALLAQIE
jgi:hypothetical protein